MCPTRLPAADRGGGGSGGGADGGAQREGLGEDPALLG